MRVLILILPLIGCLAYGAGGVPLANNDLLTEQQKLLIKSQKDLLQRQRDWQETMAKIVPVTDEPYDPEYIAILEDFDRRKEAFEANHRDIQWHIVARVMQTIDDVDARLALINVVRENPLWRRLPPTIAISPMELTNWNTARTMFFNYIRRLK